ncbi:hypothetical protein [Pseudoalteromonas rubra]|uniref:Integrase n=1 Tax=Pseudoalteromonas rubra TaxID=43658 RepID=A0A5S3X1W5_9GAMM|nr:hypothetical protein [Pseudoalteromonas rubra]TMP38286.1 hypothetical protein CWB98_07310 [Pseudoalteromonas rubra]
MLPLIQLPKRTPQKILIDFIDIIELRNKKDWEKLNEVLISKSIEGENKSYFKSQVWDMSAYTSKIQINKKSKFDFSFIKDSKDLTLEIKTIVYGWIYQKNSTRSRHIRIQTLVNRLCALKKVYIFLLNNNHKSISALNDKKTSQALDSFLLNKKLAQRTLEHVYAGINSIFRLKNWLQIELTLSTLKPYEHAVKLSKKTPQQTLAIPERIADELYSKAIDLVETYYPYRHKLADIEKELQDNYLKGKSVVDFNIKSGKWNFLNESTTQCKAREVNKASPQKSSEILSRYSSETPFKNLKTAFNWKKLYGRITTACYICCGAFSGMRDSELSVLKPNSYFCDEIDGHIFHLLQSRTFKLGEKDTTWVTAPITEKALELMTCFTKHWRAELIEANSEKESNYLWLNRTARSKPPVVIATWPDRLQLFSETYGTKITKEDLAEAFRSNPYAHDKVKAICIVGKSWPLKPHQFRRSLALYTTRHRIGTNVALKQQYKHTYLQMTNWYSVGGISSRLHDLRIDSDFQHLLEKTQLEETANKFFNMIHSDAPLSGSHGKAIMQMREDTPYIYSSWDVIYDAVKKGTLTLHGTMHSYCKNGYDCDMDGVINPAFCVDCKSGGSIIDEAQAKNWQKKHSQLTSYLKTQGDISPSIYAHCITQIRAAESVMEDFNIFYEQYKHPIEVTQYE